MRHRLHGLIRKPSTSFRELGLTLLLAGALFLPQPPPPDPINPWPDGGQARRAAREPANELKPYAEPIHRDMGWETGTQAQREDQADPAFTRQIRTRSGEKAWPKFGASYDLQTMPVVYSAGSVEKDGVAEWTKISYESYRDGNWEIYVADGAGGSAARLTNHPANDIRPSLNRGAKRIVFASDRERNERYEIYAIDVDGGNLKRLTHNDAVDSQPSWSPDGKKIAFVSTRDGNAEIYVMNADGSNETRITRDSRTDFNPCWSPDGRHLVWVRARDSYEGLLMRANHDGSYAHSLGNAMRYLQHPAFSPDGKWVAFDADLNRDWWNDIGRMSLSNDSYPVEQIRSAGSGHELWLGSWSPEAIAFNGYTKLLVTQLDYEEHPDGYYYLSDLAIRFISVTGATLGALPGTGTDALPSMQSEDIWPPRQPYIAPFAQYTSINDQPTVSWTAEDVGKAGIIMYGCEEWKAESDPLEMETIDTTMSIGAIPGKPYSVRVRAEDAAGLWGPWSETNSTIAYTWRVTGSVQDNNGVPLGNITVGAFPEVVTPVHTARDGRYLAMLVEEGTHRFSIASPLYTLATPSFSRPIEGHTRVDMPFVPDDNLIRNGSFEASMTLSDWRQSGDVTGSRDAYDGDYSAQLMLSESTDSMLEASLEQTVGIPAAMHRPTLALFYRHAPIESGDPDFHVSVTETGAPTETVIISDTGEAGMWHYVTGDLSAWSGKEIDLQIQLSGDEGDRLSKLQLDRISLGSWKTPVPTAIEPDHVDETDGISVQVYARNLMEQPAVFLGEIRLVDTTKISPGVVSANLPAELPPGIYDLRVENSGGYTSSLLNAFKVGRQIYLPLVQVE